jgi:hypothetical protein
LITFDVKGAYNGVCKERLLQRMKARGIPVDLLRWVDSNYIIRPYSLADKKLFLGPLAKASWKLLP